MLVIYVCMHSTSKASAFFLASLKRVHGMHASSVDGLHLDVIGECSPPLIVLEWCMCVQLSWLAPSW